MEKEQKPNTFVWKLEARSDHVVMHGISVMPSWRLLTQKGWSLDRDSLMLFPLSDDILFHSLEIDKAP